MDRVRRGCFAAGSAAGTNEATDEDTWIGESGRAAAIEKSGNFDNPTVENVLITAPSGPLDMASATATARDVAQRVSGLPEVATVGDPVPAPDGSAVLLPVTMSGDPKTAEDRLTPLLDQTSAAGRDHPELRIEQVGDASIGHGINETIGTDLARAELPWVIGFVLGLAFLVMALTFRSLVVALSALLLNGLSAAAAFGVLSLVFQHEWAEGLLGFESNGALIAWIPLFVFVVLVGLAMDYHVFVVSRIREAALRGMPTRDAVRYGITRSAGVVTSAAVVMVSVFSVFAFLSMVEMKQMGIGLAAAVFLDAMIVRILVLPSLMCLLGKANWWPSRAVRRSEQPPPAAPTEPLRHLEQPVR